jgi:hypothetical protein
VTNDGLTPQRVAIEKAIIALAALAIIALAIIAVDLIDYSNILGPTGMGSHGQIAESTSSPTETTQLPTNPNNTISVSGLSLCSSNCGYPAPYASALVMINASVPISTLKVYVNNTLTVSRSKIPALPRLLAPQRPVTSAPF